MRNKSIAALPLLVGIVAVPFATVQEITPFTTLVSANNSTENFGDDTINLGAVNGDGFDDVAIDSGRATHIHFGAASLGGVRDRTFPLGNSDHSPYQQLSAGRDRTGNGIDDLLIGAPLMI